MIANILVYFMRHDKLANINVPEMHLRAIRVKGFITLTLHMQIIMGVHG